MDGAIRVRGAAPSQAECILKVLDSGTKRLVESRTVTGPFEETIVVGGLFPGPVDLEVNCAGRAVKSIASVHPSLENWETPVDLGQIEP